MNISIEHPTDRPNFTIVWLPNVAIAFSYTTAIGVNQYNGWGWTCRKNEWGPTTGKHLNHLDYGQKDQRLDADAFDVLLKEVTATAIA